MLLSGSVRFVGLVQLASLVVASSRFTERPAGSDSRDGRPRSARCSSPRSGRRVAGADCAQRSRRRRARRGCRVLRAGPNVERDRARGGGARAPRRNQAHRPSRTPAAPSCLVLTYRGKRLAAALAIGVTGSRWVPPGTASSTSEPAMAHSASPCARAVTAAACCRSLPGDALRRQTLEVSGLRGRGPRGVRHSGGRRRDRRSRAPAARARRPRRRGARPAPADESRPWSVCCVPCMARLDAYRILRGHCP